MKVLRKAVPNPCNNNSLNELNNVQRQLDQIEQNIKFDKQIAESLKNLGVDYRPSNMDQLFKSSYEGQYHKLVDKVNANLNKTVQNYQQYNNVVTQNKYWNNQVRFNGNKVFQRNDLFDSNTVSSWKVNGKTVTGTNIQRMAS